MLYFTAPPNLRCRFKFVRVGWTIWIHLQSVLSRREKEKTVFIHFTFSSLLVLTDLRKKMCDFVSIGQLIYFSCFPYLGCVWREKRRHVYTYISSDICIYTYLSGCILFPAKALERKKKISEGGGSEVAVIRATATAEEIEETGLSQVSHISVAVT